MAFCPNCGSQVTGSFCPNCGTPVGGGAGAPTDPSYHAASVGGLTENLASALCYLFGFITGIVFLVIAPYSQNRTIRFHAFQSIFLSLAAFVGHILVAILGTITNGVGFFLSPMVSLLFFVLWLYMMFTAFNHKKIKLPVIGDLAEKQA